jgi:SHS2 domain-containing protein
MRSHAWHDHTAEIELALRAESLAGLLEEAGASLGELLSRSEPSGSPGPARRIEVTAVDRDALLVDWLNELLYLAETESALPVAVSVSQAEATHLVAEVRWAPVPETPSLVKAATLHGLAVREEDGGFAAEVIFDV